MDARTEDFVASHMRSQVPWKEVRDNENQRGTAETRLFT